MTAALIRRWYIAAQAARSRPEKPSASVGGNDKGPTLIIILSAGRVDGILHLESTEFADVFEKDFHKKQLNLPNSLRFSLRPGNSVHSGDVEFMRC